jgi:hypothetical protein
MQAFDDVLYPLALGRDAGVSAEFSTSIAVTASGHERRGSQWSDARLHFDVGPGIRSRPSWTLIAFFRARPGRHAGSGCAIRSTSLARDDRRAAASDPAARRRRRAHRALPAVQALRRAEHLRFARSPAARGERGRRGRRSAGERVGRSRPAAGLPFAVRRLRSRSPRRVPVRRPGPLRQRPLEWPGAVFAAGEAPSVPLVEVREAA